MYGIIRNYVEHIFAFVSGFFWDSDFICSTQNRGPNRYQWWPRGTRAGLPPGGRRGPPARGGRRPPWRSGAGDAPLKAQNNPLGGGGATQKLARSQPVAFVNSPQPAPDGLGRGAWAIENLLGVEIRWKHGETVGVLCNGPRAYSTPPPAHNLFSIPGTIQPFFGGSWRRMNKWAAWWRPLTTNTLILPEIH